ncbi:MAG: hypothetical protein M3362_07295 [Acidobacteriota bacterium]|nr:hypothetical protein [Acidobacteriota bacterium]
MELTVSVVGERYCAVSDDLNSLQMTLRLRYTNTGGQKIILYRGVRLFYQIFVSRRVEDLAARRYETRTTHSRYYDQLPEKIDAPNPGSVFTTLPPGASYETLQTIALPVARGDRAVGNSITSGEHVLQVWVSTWYESKKLAQTLRERWQRRGFLWADALGAKAVSFNVEKNPQAIVCQ